MNKLIETERLYIRKLIPDDTRIIFKLHNNPDVMKYMPGYAQNPPYKKIIDFVNGCIQYYLKSPGFGIWPTILKDRNKFVGWTTLKNLDNTGEIEIGYRFFPQYWGQGLCTEISRALLEYGFNELSLNRIVGISNPKNKASIRVLEKIGLKYEKVARYYGTDVVYYALNKNINR